MYIKERVREAEKEEKGGREGGRRRKHAHSRVNSLILI